MGSVLPWSRAGDAARVPHGGGQDHCGARGGGRPPPRGGAGRAGRSGDGHDQRLGLARQRGRPGRHRQALHPAQPVHFGHGDSHLVGGALPAHAGRCRQRDRSLRRRHVGRPDRRGGQQGLPRPGRLPQGAPGPGGPAYDLADFDPGVWHVGGVWAGKNIGIPFYNNTMLFYYRKDLFADAKLRSAFQAKYNRPLAVPATWKEAVDVARFFTRKYTPGSPTEYGIGLMFPRTHTLFYMYVIYWAPYRRSPSGLSQWGPVDLDYGDFFTSRHQPAFANAQGVQALKDMMALMPYSPDPLGSDYGETIEYFSKGTVAMVPQWTGVWASFTQAQVLQPLDQKVGVAVMPSGHSVSGIWGLGINRATKHPVEAFKFVQWATNKQNDKEKFIKFGVAPARISSLRDPEVRKADPRVPALLKTYPAQGYRPRIPSEPKLEDVTVGTFSEILGGRRPADVATLRALATEWQRIVKSA